MLAAEMLSEPVAVPEFFVNGIAKIEDVCGNLRFTLFALHRDIYGGEVEREVVIRLIMPTHSVVRAAMQASNAAQSAMLEKAH